VQEPVTEGIARTLLDRAATKRSIKHPGREQGGRLAKITFLAILSVHVAFLAYAATVHSPVSTETERLAAGLSHLDLGAFGLYRVNPPLVRTVAAVPVALARPHLDWRLYDANPRRRSEYAVGAAFSWDNRRRLQDFVVVARWACIPFSVVGAIVCFSWANSLYGSASGVVSSALWCFSPMIIGHGHLLTPDVGAAALGAAAAYTFWMWLRDPCWSRAFFAGVVLGLAELTKLTLVVFFGLWPILWIIWRLSHRPREMRCAEATCSPQGLQLCMLLFLALYCLNAGYLFDGTCRALKDYHFGSEMLRGERAGARSGDSENRFADTWLADVPVPFPKHYVYGIDQQRQDFEGNASSYLRGEWRSSGWWYYYLYALLVKVPLGYWGIAVLAATHRLLDRQAGAWRDECMLVVPSLAILVLVSSQTGFNHHARYVLPVLPFAFIWTASIARATKLERRTVSIGLPFLLLWAIGSSLWAFPHSLSYFNELAGGPRNGPAHLLNSNIDWGQDFLYLKRWTTTHTTSQLRYAALAGGCAAIRDDVAVSREPPLEPLPGCYALSVNEIHSRSKQYRHFLGREPVAMAGYSIYIYDIDLDEANRVRRELGLPELPGK